MIELAGISGAPDMLRVLRIEDEPFDVGESQGAEPECTEARRIL